MKRKRAFACLLSVAAVMSTVATPSAVAAAQCQYDLQDLPVPAGVAVSKTAGGSSDDSRIAGWTEVAGEHDRGLVWVNGAVRQMSPAQGHVRPKDVNNTGVVAGYEEIPDGVAQWQPWYRAFRYENGTYEYLQVEEDEQAQAVGVNDAGDVVGIVWSKSWPGDRTVVVWPRTGERRSFGVGQPVGITGDRKVVLSTTNQAWVADADTGARTALPGAHTEMVLDNDRVLGYEYVAHDTYRISEVDLSGVVVGAYDRGLHPFGRNTAGTVFGLAGGPDLVLWQGGGRTEVATYYWPDTAYYGDVTADGVLIGTYEGADGNFRAARWVRAC